MRVEQLITSHWDAMGEFDRAHRVKIVVDEWGSWYTPGTEPFPRPFSVSRIRCGMLCWQESASMCLIVTPTKSAWRTLRSW